MSLSIAHNGAIAPRAERLPLRARAAVGPIEDVPREAWDVLSENAVVENPFYSSQYVTAGLNTIDRHRKVEAFTVQRPLGELAALFPFRRHLGIAFAHRNLYQFNTTPLVCGLEPSLGIRAWLDAIAAGEVPPCWLFRDFPIETELWGMIEAGAAQRGLATSVVDVYSRPVLTKLEGGFDRHVATVLSSSRRRSILRNMRRLEAKGTLRFERATEPELVAVRLEEFLLLERAGWKGERGTSLMSKRSHHAFALQAFERRCARGVAWLDVLLFDDVPIALNLNLSTGRTVFTPKTTYDERFRSYSPGLILEYMALRAFYAEQKWLSMDATTTVENNLMETLWNRRTAMASVVVGTPLAVGVTRSVMRWHDAARAQAKRARDILQRGRTRGARADAIGQGAP